MQNYEIAREIVDKMKRRMTRGVIAMLGFALLMTVTKFSRQDYDGIAIVCGVIGSMCGIAIVEYFSFKKIVIEGLRK